MRIKKITWQHRRDFEADMICPNCNNIEKLTAGYDDAFYHNNVIPEKKCSKCNKSENDLNVNYKPRPTKYEEGQVI